MSNKGLVLVTGASGFVAKYVIAGLISGGYEVRGTLRDLKKADSVRQAVANICPIDSARSQLEFVETDLLADAGWAAAMNDVSAIMHVAATVVKIEPKDADSVVRPAVEGTRRVMEAAHAAGVRRVILTSSIATVGYGHGHKSGERTYTEQHFTNLDAMAKPWAYCIGKTRAEQAAWSYARANDMALTTIHPGMILGPASDQDTSISLGLVSGLLDGSTPAMLNMGFAVIDVRDVAAMHIAALENDESIGERYLATNRYIHFTEVAEILRQKYPDRPITRKVVPDWMLRIMARMGAPVRQIINDVGNVKHFEGRKGERLLGRPYISAEEAVLSAAETVTRFGLLSDKAVPKRRSA
ncbi:nucleoside-diphosphate sugar epimerase [Devosia pacifica]|uniref:Nucleoside-diphosphate sugar epimerase n=1 Tax=Devosia pacifica TaxID=1335967 RepID=A0A918RVP7_9HYPH|nr:NAD-dependent epimerase/dehydratase family protein [Devosia pacifica]GHA12753.1 nucleoside-diphosphate sugar epimerase [Devosia pacifica]